MAINIQNLTAAEKAIQSKYIQIGNGLLPDAIKTVEELYPSVLNVWEHKYLIVNEMLMAIGYDKIGAWLSKNEVMMYIRQACAYESKNNNDKEGVVKDLPYAFAHILMVRKANAELLTELYKDKMVSEAQIERIKAARDRIAVKVNVTEEGARVVNQNASSKRAPHQKQTDPEIMAAINAASKPDTSYNINVLVSSLKKEGLNVEIADDGSAIVWTNIEDNRLDVGIIRPDSIDEDLKNLNRKCLSLGKGIDLSVVINKKQEPHTDNESSAEAAVSSLVGTFEYQNFYDFKDEPADKEENPYDELAEQTAPKTKLLTFDVDLEYQDRICRVQRQISVLSEEKNFYHGYVYHNNGNYLGHWYWNVKYLRPIFTSKQDIGDKNKASYELAIRKALRTIGIYCRYMPDSADRYSKQNKAAV